MLQRLLTIIGLCVFTIGLAQAQSVSSNIIYQPAGNTVAGNPNGKITVVEFFDYNCGYCRAIYPQVEQLLKKNKDIRLVFRDYPILSENSIPPAQAALAAQLQNKYLSMQKALMTATKPLDEKEVLSLAKGLGLNTQKLAQDLSNPIVLRQIDANFALGQALGIKGTPTFIIAKTPPLVTAHPIVVAGPDINELQKLISQVANED